jgi:hypothetical protein
MATTYTISGTLRGELWWPMGTPATKTFERRWSDYRPSRDRYLLRHLAEEIMRAEDGDFSSAPVFLADTSLTVTRESSAGQSIRRHSRTWPLTAFSSIADYVSDEWPEFED